MKQNTDKNQMEDATTTPNLEELLNSMDSDEGRVKAISYILHKEAFYNRKISVPDKLVSYAISYYENAGLWKDATKIAINAKIPEKVKELALKAIEYYEKEQWFWRAADIAKKLGMNELAILFYEKSWQFSNAAELAMRIESEKFRIYSSIANLLK